MRLATLLVAVTVLLVAGACRSPTAPRCRVTGTTTGYVYTATGDSLLVTVTTKWCD